MTLRSRFLTGFVWRLALLLLCAWAFVQALATPGLGAARVTAGLALLGTAALLWHHVQRTNRELARFVEAVRFGDFAQGFGHGSDGSGFGELGRALDAAMRNLRNERHSLSEANRFYEAVLDDAPTALLTVDGAGKVELANKAARRLLVRHSGVRVEDFAIYGDAFTRALEGGAVGRPRLIPLVTDDVPQAMLVSGAVVHRLGGLVRVVAVQPIQGELNAVEIAAQSDLIRVLTHEIMNSMTPVTSLAHSAAALIRQADKGENPDIADARAAVETLARRADGVMHFVESYRQISRAPELRRRVFPLLPWAQEIEALFRASAAARGLDFQLSVEPEGQTLDADPDLLCQVLINLLKNGAEAAREHGTQPRLALRFARTRSGQCLIEVEDNGPGIAPPLRQDVFLPFFTTKAKGTGVGLSLARQVVLAHRGTISVEEAGGGGALFRLVI